MPDNYLDAILKQGEDSLARRSESIAKFNTDHPPRAERMIELYGEQSTVGIWESNGSFGYAIKRSNGYNPQEIHWLNDDLLALIDSARALDCDSDF